MVVFRLCLCNTCRMVVEYAREHGDEKELKEHLVQLVELDEAGPEVLHLAQIYIQGTSCCPIYYKECLQTPFFFTLHT